MAQFILASGFYAPSGPAGQAHRDFFKIWAENNRRTIAPKATYIISAAGKPFLDDGVHQWITAENLGHVMQMPEQQVLGGWSASFLMSCLIAYHNKADLIYKEQDCLAFGPWVQRLYEEIGNAGMITGKMNTTGDAAGLLAQSLLLVRHGFLLPMIGLYCSIQQTDRQVVPEHKFNFIAQRTNAVRQTTMGCDRSRPIPFDDPAFYVQQLTTEEIAELRARKLIPIAETTTIPPNARKIQFGCGSNVLSGWENYDAEVDITRPLPFPDGSADVVFAEHTVEHVTPQQAWGFFEECKRILKPGGVIRIAVPSAEQIAERSTPHYEHFLFQRGFSESPTGPAAIKAIIFGHGHQAIWSQKSLVTVLQAVGFRDAVPCEARQSRFGLDVNGHGRVIGEVFNQIETIVVEAVK
jgi:hypothetical protein